MNGQKHDRMGMAHTRINAMTAIWRQLIWKEWREQVWKMISLTAIVFSVEAYSAFSDVRAGEPAIGGFGLFCGIAGAFFIAIGVAAGERSAGSLGFLRALPLARWKWAVVRLAMGAIAAVVPIVVTAIAMLLLDSTMRAAAGTPRYLSAGAVAVLCCISVYAWTAAAGVRGVSELRAGLAAICLFVGGIALVAILTSVGAGKLAGWLTLFSPAGVSYLPVPAQPPPLNSLNASSVLWAQLVSFIATSWWFVRRYAALTSADDRSPAASEANPSTTLRPALRSPLAAIVWKEYREALPMCLAGLAIAAAVVLPTVLSATGAAGSEKLPVLSGFLIFLGTIMALVLGVGGLAGDLEAGVSQFWRSRPISATSWFWLKYATGAVVLMLVFDGVPAVIDLLVGGPGLLVREAPFWFGPLLHLLAYSAAVWMVCQLRQPIYAGILALGVVSSLLTMADLPVQRPLLPWLDVSRLSTCRHLDLETSLLPLFDWLVATYLPFAAPMVAISGAMALLGWRAVRRAA